MHFPPLLSARPLSQCLPGPLQRRVLCSTPHPHPTPPSSPSPTTAPSTLLSPTSRRAPTSLGSWPAYGARSSSVPSMVSHLLLSLSLYRASSRRNATGTIVATLMTPIGSHFKKSNQASYIGTSYLLSVCCFTPLYGECISPPRAQSTHIRSGRLSDILGRRGAMLLALTLFGTRTSSSPEPTNDRLAFLKAWVQSSVVWRPPWRLSSRLVQ